MYQMSDGDDLMSLKLKQNLSVFLSLHPNMQSPVNALLFIIAQERSQRPKLAGISPRLYPTAPPIPTLNHPTCKRKPQEKLEDLVSPQEDNRLCTNIPACSKATGSFSLHYR